MARPPAEDRLVITGRASRLLEPDRAIWHVAVHEEAADERSAYDRCVQRANALGDGLRAAAGDEGKVSTGLVRVAARYDYRRERHTGHRATSTATIDVPLDRAGQAVAAAMDAGASSVSGPAFRVSERERAQEELLAEAVAAARRKAERLAEAAGRALGAVISIVEAGGEDLDFDTGYQRASVRTLAAAADEAAAPEISAEEHEVSAQVSVVFALD